MWEKVRVRVRSSQNRGACESACGAISEVRTCVRRTGIYIATQRLTVTFGQSAHGDTPPPLRHADVLNEWSLTPGLQKVPKLYFQNHFSMSANSMLLKMTLKNNVNCEQVNLGIHMMSKMPE